MPKLAKITALIFGFAFSQSVPADVCDFEYSGDYYAEIPEYPMPIICSYDPYEDLEVNESKTEEHTYPDGSKTVTVFTLLGDKCFKMGQAAFDSIGSLIGSYNSVEKHSQLLQATFNDVTVNINYDNPPCNFSVVEASGRSTAFNFIGSADDPEYDRVEKELPNVIAGAIKSQGQECRKYKEYKEYLKKHEDYLKDIEWLWK